VHLLTLCNFSGFGDLGFGEMGGYHLVGAAPLVKANSAAIQNNYATSCQDFDEDNYARRNECSDGCV